MEDVAGSAFLGFRLAIGDCPKDLPGSVEALLWQLPMLEYLPNTAYRSIANLDTTTLPNRYRERTPAIHLQDWTPRYKRPQIGPDHGLTALGAGIVPLESTLESLEAHGYEGWIIVGRYAGFHPEIDLMRCSQWLADHGFLSLAPLPLGLLAVETAAVLPGIQAVNDEFMRWLSSHPDDLLRVHPGTFERIVAEIFDDKGYEVRQLGGWNQADGGIDIVAVGRDSISGGIRIGIQCKRYVRQRIVRADIIWALDGRLEKFKLHKGVLVTTAHFEKGVLSDASEHLWRIELVDFERLKSELQEWGTPGRRSLWLPRGLDLTTPATKRIESDAGIGAIQPTGSPGTCTCLRGRYNPA
jgi:hypothetical protein